MYLELRAILAIGNIAMGLSRFLDSPKVYQARSRGAVVINGKLDTLMSESLKSALSFLDMTRSNPNASVNDFYFEQALIKFVSASNLMSEEHPDYGVALSGLSMCQYYKKDYINAIKSLDKSLYALLPTWKDYLKYKDRTTPLTGNHSDDFFDVFIIKHLMDETPSFPRYALKSGESDFISQHIDYDILNKFRQVTSLMADMLNKAVAYNGFSKYSYRDITPVAQFFGTSYEHRTCAWNDELQEAYDNIAYSV